MGKKHLILEVFGWYGTVAIVLAYLLNSFNVVDSSSLFYQLLNLTGALGIICISLYKKVYQPAAINIVWTIIAIIALVRIIFA